MRRRGNLASVAAACLSQQWVIFGITLLLAALFFAVSFLDIPVNTEARNYLFGEGSVTPSIFFSGLVYPAGANMRVVSMLAFGLTRRACQLDAPCVNAVQIIELLAGLVIGMIHLQQLIPRPRIVAVAMLFWCASLPVFAAGFWQATQHDKLAFVFSLAALSLGLRALRKHQSKNLAVKSIGLTILFMLALNAKESAFILPPAAIVQIALFAPGGLRGLKRAATLYGLPVAYAVCYIAIYFWRIQGSWQTHVLSGHILKNAGFYLGSLLWAHDLAGLAIIPVVAMFLATLHLCRQQNASGLPPLFDSEIARITLYLLMIFFASIVLVIRAQVPGDYYLLFGEWAFVGWIAAAVATAGACSRPAKIAVTACSALLVMIFAWGRAMDVRAPGGTWQLLREAHHLNTGYRLIQRYCTPHLTAGLKLAFADEPAGHWFFFRGGNEAPDQLLGAFICEDGQIPVMRYSFDGSACPDVTGQLVVAWSAKLKITSVGRNGNLLYQAATFGGASGAPR